MSSIIDRIGEYAKAVKLSIRKIEQKIGAGNGTISKAVGRDKDIQTKWLAFFIEKYPEVNPAWLLTGKGEMILREDEAEDPDYPSSKIDDPDDVYQTKIMKQNRELIDSLKKVIQALEGQLTEKERVVQLKDRLIRDLEEKLGKPEA